MADRHRREKTRLTPLAGFFLMDRFQLGKEFIRQYHRLNDREFLQIGHGLELPLLQRGSPNRG
jgi:hypothetical protein